MKSTIFSVHIRLLVFVILAVSLGGCVESQKRSQAIRETAPLRSAALDDLFVLQDYRAHKNSFVESPARHIGTWTEKCYRYTLLDAEGEGSIRHIWSTRGGGEPYFEWEFYVDGEKTPSVHGTDEDLIRAAERYGVPVAPANSVPLLKRDFNLFLPIPFEKSIRIDVVQRNPTFWLWFCQIDYRLGDDSMKGVRAFSEGTGKDLKLSYIGIPEQRRQQPASALSRIEEAFEDVSMRPGEMLCLASFDGPAIVRELRLQWPENSNLRLLIRYDDEETFAVDSPVDPFFGPFRGVPFFQFGENDSACYLPMPFRKNADILVRNEGDETARVSGKAVAEIVPAFSDSWGYFHARHQKTERTNGHRLHQVLYARGRGHWVGMTLYKTGHDHGGGDFTVIDGEGDDPSFLHGVNGEDYFTFAWFGRGAHHPYAIAHSNDEGRYRLHLENVYPFKKSIAIEWGAFPDISPESVAFWYQDSPGDTTVPDGARADSTEWDVFGPVPIPHDANGKSIDDPFSVLPSIEDLDAGKEFLCTLYKEQFTSGWMKDWTVGPMLNLTYIGRHGTEIGGEIELWGMGHAYLARRFVESERDRYAACLFAHDDPIEVEINGIQVYRGGQQFNGFENKPILLPLKKGKNEIVVRLSNYFNRDFNWTGFFMRIEDENESS